MLDTEARGRLLSRLDEARSRTDSLFALIRPEALTARPIPERQRIVFYLGHLEAFDWNLIGAGVFAEKPFAASLDRLFAFGIDPIDGDIPNEPASAWPEIAAVRDYNRRVRESLDRLLGDASWADPGRPFLADGTILNAAIEHRLMHAETLAYLLHQLAYAEKVPVHVPARPLMAPATDATVAIPAGIATLGLAPGPGGTFGWDNELGEHEVAVGAFAIDRYPVTNRRFLELVRAGGYHDRSLWDEAGWQWRSRVGLEHPRFWIRERESLLWRGMFAPYPLPLDDPVYVSHAEASAFARFSGRSLPTEVEWHRAAYGTPAGTEQPFPWGDAQPAAAHGNFGFARWDPTPVTAHPLGDSAFGVGDLLGNGWEWTSTPFAPLPGFTAYSFYPGYSADFFDGRHFVIKGGSARTAACFLRRSFRNWFQPHYPSVYATFRLVDR